MKLLETLVFFICILVLPEVKASIGTRIIGGTAAYAGQFPFAAAITVTTSKSKHFCGGTLVSNIWIITAGQCVDGATEFTISLGSNKLSGVDSNRVIVSTNDYVLHPEYNPETLENDIGFIKLRITLEFSGYLKKVDFLGTHYVVAATTMMAVGWGQTSDESAEFSEDLQWTTVAALTNDDCKVTYGNQISDSTVCVDGNYNEGSCYGDTGSGLLQDIGRGYKMLVGVASFHSGNGCESTDPSGYVRISEYSDWISTVMTS